MNILEVNKSCFKDCFYSYYRVDVCSCPFECFPLPIVFPVPLSSNLLVYCFSSFSFPFPRPFLDIIVKCVFSFTISHRRSLPTFSWVGSIVFLQRGSCPAGRLYQVSWLSRNHSQPALPGRRHISKRMEPLPHRRKPGSGRSIFNELLFISA